MKTENKLGFPPNSHNKQRIKKSEKTIVEVKGKEKRHGT